MRRLIRLIHDRIDRLQVDIKAFSKFRWLSWWSIWLYAAIIIGARSVESLSNVLDTINLSRVIIERQ